LLIGFLLFSLFLLFLDWLLFLKDNFDLLLFNHNNWLSAWQLDHNCNLLDLDLGHNWDFNLLFNWGR
jgi:hypothetical protein